MEWFIALLAIVVLGLAAAAAAGGLGQLGPVTVDRPPFELSPEPLTAEDLAETRFLIVPRGYAMDQVDEVMGRLQGQLRDMAGTPTSDSGIIESKQTSVSD